MQQADKTVCPLRTQIPLAREAVLGPTQPLCPSDLGTALPHPAALAAPDKEVGHTQELPHRDIGCENEGTAFSMCVIVGERVLRYDVHARRHLRSATSRFAMLWRRRLCYHIHIFVLWRPDFWGWFGKDQSCCSSKDPPFHYISSCAHTVLWLNVHVSAKN